MRRFFPIDTSFSCSFANMTTNRQAICFFRFLCLTVWIIVACPGLLTVFTSAALAAEPHIVILNSYHPGYVWSDQETSGLLETVRAVYPTIDPPIEHLDSKRFTDEQHLIRFKEFLVSKYRGKKTDLVIALDNPAFDLILQYRHEIFPGVPVVFAGVSGLQPGMLNKENGITGVAEVRDIAGALHTALTLHPETEKVLIVHDYTVSGRAVRKEVEEVLPEFAHRVSFEFLDPMPLHGVLDRIKSLPLNSIVLLLTFTTDSTGKSFPLKETTRLISAMDFPVYGDHESRLGHGIVGGMLLGGKEHGCRAGEFALRILSGEDPAKIPIDWSGGSKPMFDHQQLQKFEISVDALPEGSFIVNRPESLYEKHRGVILGTLSALAALNVMVILLGLAVLRRRKAENALRESEQRYRVFVETASEGIWAVDATRRITLVNQVMCGMLGYDMEQIVGHPVSHFIAPDQMADHNMRMKNREAGIHEKYERKFLRRNGEALWVIVSASPLLNREGGFEGAFSMLTDITERKQTEEALRASELFLKETQRIARVGGWKANPHARYVEWTDGVYEILGSSPERGTFWEEATRCFLPEYLSTFVDNTARCLATGEAFAMECRVTTGSGRVIWAEIRGLSPVVESERSYVIGTFQDIDDRKRAEETLRLTQFSVEQAADPIYWTGPDGRILYANEAACSSLGYSRHEILALSAPDIQPGLNSTDWQAFCEKFKKDGPLSFEAEHIRKDRSIIPTEISATHLAFDGKEIHIFFIRDISERKRAEAEREVLEGKLRQSQKIEAIGTLAGGIAHDFNNILAPIIGYTEMALRDALSHDPMRYGLEQILHGAVRARDLVKQILAFGRSGREQERVPIEVSSVVKEVLNLLRASLPSSIEIRRHIENGVARADATQIHQLLVNLCTNAAHAMNEKGILDVSLSSIDLNGKDLARLHALDLEPGRYLRLCVSDTGEGMDGQTMERIFDPYFTTKEVGKGSGLGLAVVHGIVKRHKGAVSAHSERGKGTTFTVYIPATDEVASVIPETRQALPRGTERILFVDDERIVNEVGSEVLARLGYKVTSELDCIQALEMYRSNPDDFDLIITDYTMPRLNGADLAREMRKIRPDLPIILCTGYSEKVTVESAAKQGMRLLLKPLGMRQLATVVREVLDAGKGLK